MGRPGSPRSRRGRRARAAARATTAASPTNCCAGQAASNGHAPTRHPDGTERLYVDGQFNTDPDFCETFGHDLATGAPRSETEYRAIDPDGRAFLYGIEYEEPPEQVDDRIPDAVDDGTNPVPIPHPNQDRTIAPTRPCGAGPVGGNLRRRRRSARDRRRRSSPRRIDDEARSRCPHESPQSAAATYSSHFTTALGSHPTSAAIGPATHQTSSRSRSGIQCPSNRCSKMAAVRVTKLGDDSGAPSTAPTTTASAPAGTTSVPQTQGGDAALSQSTVASDARTEGDRA